jgi:hypothetical protein
MNKQQLTAHLKQSAANVDEILKAAELPLNLQVYSPEQVTMLESIVQLVDEKKAKTFKEAGGLYRKIQSGVQLQQIAQRYSMDERIPEFLSALKLKPDNLTEAQFEQFRKVCEQVQQGMEPSIVAQGVLNEAKAKPSPASGAMAKTDGRSEGDTDLVVAAKNEITAPASRFNESTPGDVREAISQFPREDAQAVVLKSPGIIADAIEVAHDTTEQGLTNFVQQEWFDEYRKGVSDPAFGSQVREMLAQGKSQKTSEGSST